jgi:hypothetical protein
MADARYGKHIVGELSDSQTLPNATSADSTNMVYIGGQTGGQLWINVYAQNAVEIATGQAFNIELEGYSSDTAASATPPFSTANQGGVNGVTGTAESDGHYYIFHKTSADGEAAFAAGDLITQCAIPEDLFRLLEYDYVQLKYTSDADESADIVDAFVWIKPS